MRVAIFPGTFDPFTLGHMDILKRSLSLFDKIIVGVGINNQKKTMFSIDERVEFIKNCFKNIKPDFNTTVIFQTDNNSYHGHPNPLNCPSDVFRRSLATYYYVLHDEDINNVKIKSTDYKKLPHEKYNEDIEKLRSMRAMGRLKDETT